MKFKVGDYIIQTGKDYRCLLKLLQALPLFAKGEKDWFLVKCLLDTDRSEYSNYTGKTTKWGLDNKRVKFKKISEEEALVEIL